MATMDIKVQRLEEFQIARKTHGAIAELLQLCFPGYPPDRSYFKQVPTFRYLVWHKDYLIGHMGVEHRVLNNAGSLLAIFGIVDLCVHPEFQHRKLGSRLIMEVETLGKVHGIDFLVLLARDFDLYQAHGFLPVYNDCQWLVINEHRTYGVAHRSLGDGLMVKPLGQRPWVEGQVDFLGHIF